MRKCLFTSVVTLGVLTALAPLAHAQVFGTFAWQMQPYCNRIELTLTNTPAGFTLDGADDQCGSGRGSAFGTAVFTPTGTVALNFTIVSSPGGKGVHVSGVVNPGTGSGTWTDSVGNSGAFALGGATPGLPARPVPASGVAPLSIGGAELVDGAVGTSKVNANQVQLRVTGACPAGQLMTGINANGTVVCSAPLSQQLSCVETVSAGATIAAGSFGSQQTPSCAAGYTITGGSCSMSNFDGRVVTSRTIVTANSQTHFCAFRNEGGIAVDGLAYARCCRVQ